MEVVWKKEDFTVTAEQIAKAQGVSTTTILRQSLDGAYPYMGRAKAKANKHFHKSCLTMLGGVIKYNRSVKKYVEPVITMDPEPKTANPNPSTNQLLTRLMLKIEALDVKHTRMLTRMETKIHAIAEGKDLKSNNTTIGDMVKKSLEH